MMTAMLKEISKLACEVKIPVLLGQGINNAQEQGKPRGMGPRPAGDKKGSTKDALRQMHKSVDWMSSKITVLKTCPNPNAKMAPGLQSSIEYMYH